MKIEKVLRQAKIRMSKKAMADFMYALIMTKTKITSTHGIGIYAYDRSQNCYNDVDIMIEIEEDKQTLFKNISGASLSKPIEIHVN